MKPLVSIIIPTYNRFQFLLKTVASCEAQTYEAIEIIVVNDCSTDPQYYSYPWANHTNVRIIHLTKNSRQIYGFPCAGHVRNEGINVANGHYIAFCDDDDTWFPQKVELQIESLQKYPNCKMSCTEALFGAGPYDTEKIYKKYNSEQFFQTLHRIYKQKKSNALDRGFPTVWNLSFLRIHNCIVCSSVLMEKSILDTIQNFKLVPNGKEDYDCWLRALQNTNCVYLDIPLVYYDSNHGAGRNY